jgi:hypothetical protein
MPPLAKSAISRLAAGGVGFRCFIALLFILAVVSVLGVGLLLLAETKGTGFNVDRSKDGRLLDVPRVDAVDDLRDIPEERETATPSVALDSLAPADDKRQFFSRAERAAFARYGNGRAIIPLLLTSLEYHGASLLATTIHSWIVHFLVPQRNIDVVIFYDKDAIKLDDLILRLRLKRANSITTTPSTAADFRDGADEVTRLSEGDRALLLGDGGGMFTTPYHATFAIRIHPVRVPLPDYISKNLSLLQEPSWLRCGCPPVCPQKRATVGYVQGTRWYTYDLFLEPIARRYSYWIKLDVDIWFFRPPEFNLVDAMARTGAVFAHTGYIYNGEGCSNDLHKALLSYLADRNFSAVSGQQPWWVQDDNVYYSNFVVSSMGFHLNEAHLELSRYLSEYRNGFFRYRWTDQSLFHKVFGVFLGPHENMFALDWSHFRCQKRAFRPKAVFYHSKQLKKKAMLKRCTNI